MFPRIAVVSGLFSESPRHKEYSLCARRRDPNNNNGEDDDEDLIVYALRYGMLIYLFSVKDCIFLDSASKAKKHPSQSDLRCDIQLSGVNATVFLYHHFF